MCCGITLLKLLIHIKNENFCKGSSNEAKENLLLVSPNMGKFSRTGRQAGNFFFCRVLMQQNIIPRFMSCF